MNAPYAALALVVYGDGSNLSTLTLLVVSRPYEPMNLGLPGGLVDWGETGAEAAVRELAEETNVRAQHAVKVFSAKNENGQPVETYVPSKFDPRFPYKRMEPGIAVGRVHPGRLLSSECRYRDYHRQLFRALGWMR